MFPAIVLSAALDASVAAAVRSEMAQEKVPGAAIAIVRNGRMLYEKGFGIRRLGGSGRVTVNTHFEIGSDTKQFTAAAILQLKERGRLALGDRLSKYIPGFPHAGEVTLYQLLSHTSGLFDYVQTNHMVRISQAEKGSLQKIERMASGPLRFAPGSRWEYSNTNYIALGRVIEVVSGESYEHYLREHILKPAGMSQTFTIDDEVRLSDMAHGHWRNTRDHGVTAAPEIGASWTWSAGELVSTVGDMAKWDAALQSGRIIDKADLSMMTSPATLADGAKDDYGFGWWIDPLRGHERIYHDGDTYGMSSSNNLFPQEHVQIIVLANESGDVASKIAVKAFEALVR